MKFLVTGQPGPAPMPPEQAVGLLQAAKEWMNARLADGRVDCHYVFPQGGGIIISNADSHEALMDGLLEYPLFPFMTWEIKALCDWSHGTGKFIELFQKVAP
jgi:muconolactone delta-isomerase